MAFFTALVLVLLALLVLLVDGSSRCRNNNKNQKPSLSSQQQSDLLPQQHVTDWPHRPVYLQADANTTRVLNRPAKEQALPLGVPLEIDTPLFQGRILFRFRNAKSDDPASHEAYFGNDRNEKPGGQQQQRHKRLMQTVVQGRFKKEINMADVYVGSVFQRPIQLVPPKSIRQVLQAVLGRTAPGIVLDLASDQPRVVSLLAGAPQMIRVDTPGNEPDVLHAHEFIENFGEAVGKVFKSIKHRQKHMNRPDKAARYHFDPTKIYTFHSYDESMDYGTYTIKLPFYPNYYRLDQVIGAQPMSLTAVVPSTGETVFHFNVWHESVYRQRLLLGSSSCDDDLE
jgi:hypothetical protein